MTSFLRGFVTTERADRMKTYVLGVVCLLVLAMILCGLLFDTEVYFISVIVSAVIFVGKSLLIELKNREKKNNWRLAVDIAGDILRNISLIITVKAVVDVIEKAAASDVSIAGFAVIMGLFIAEVVVLSLAVFVGELCAILRVYGKNERIKKTSRIISTAATVLLVITAVW